MPRWIIGSVRAIEAFNRFIGRISLYLFFVLGLILIWAIVAKGLSRLPLWRMDFDPGTLSAWFVETFKGVFRPPLWTQEMSQYTLVAYFMLGGAYTMQLGSHVRMDLLYQTWSVRRRALADALTSIALIFFLYILLHGGIESTMYAIEISERSRSVWRPYLAPVKIVICIGAAMMLLQSLCLLVRDIATLRGVKF